MADRVPAEGHGEARGLVGMWYFVLVALGVVGGILGAVQGAVERAGPE